MIYTTKGVVLFGLMGLLIAVAGLVGFVMFLVPSPLFFDTRVPGLILMVAALVLVASVQYRVRKLQNKSTIYTASAFALLVLVLILASGYHYFLPYRTSAFTVNCTTHKLSGTLFTPRKSGQFPGVLCIHGTTDFLRTQNRAYADALARRGYAVLIYDKRGTGRSSGDAQFAKLPDLAGDALAAFRMLQNMEFVDAAHCGFLGNSEGGVVAGIAAQQAGDCAFLVKISSPGLSLGEQMMYYHGQRLAEYGIDEEAAGWVGDMRNAIWESYYDEQTYADVYQNLMMAKDYDWYTLAGLPPILDQPVVARNSSEAPFRWINEDLNHDPLVPLMSNPCPVLFIFGSDDSIVPVEESERRIRFTFPPSGPLQYDIKVYEGARHSMYQNLSSSKLNYPRLPSTMFEDIFSWLDLYAF